MRKTMIVGMERRTLVGVTEFTMASLLSGKATRVHLKQAPPPGVSGAYAWDSDTVLLFPVLEGLESITVAVEEAGHSLHREDYLHHARSIVRYVNDCEKAGLPKARLWLDWIEDGRVFQHLLKTYPGAADLFTRLWEFKRRNAQENLDYGRKTKDVEQKIISSVCEEIASGYLAGKASPKSYAHVLKLARAYLNAAKKTLQEAPTQGENPEPQQGKGEPQEGQQGESKGEPQEGKEDSEGKGAQGEDDKEDEPKGKGDKEGEEKEPSGHSSLGQDEEGTSEEDPEEDEDSEDTEPEGEGDSEGEREEGEGEGEGKDEDEGEEEEGKEEGEDEGEGEEGEEEGGNLPGGSGAGIGPHETEEEENPPAPLIVGVMLATPAEEAAWVNAEPAEVRRLYAGRWRTLDSQIIDLRREGI